MKQQKIILFGTEVNVLAGEVTAASLRTSKPYANSSETCGHVTVHLRGIEKPFTYEGNDAEKVYSEFLQRWADAVEE